MLWLRVLLSRVKGLATQGDAQGELNEELRSHLEMLVDEKTSQGAPAQEARRQAMLELGNRAQIQEAYRDQRTGEFS